MPALSSADISHYRYLSLCSKHLTFQTHRITANAVILYTLKNHTGASAEALYQEVAKTSFLPWQRRVTTISQYLPAKIQKVL